MYSYLTLSTGPAAGSNFSLEGADQVLIGRGSDCHIVLTDPLSSRVHAIVSRQTDGSWWVHDSQSRNGTFVDGQKIDEAQLRRGCRIRIGTVQFVFHQTTHPPPGLIETAENVSLTQTAFRDAAPSDEDDALPAEAALWDADRAQDFLTLYQLSLTLLQTAEPAEVIRISLDLLHTRCRASISGFLWVNDDGQLKPQLLIPEESGDHVTLSESLTQQALRENRAVWINSPTAAGVRSHKLDAFTDAICVPLVREKNTLGAIHVYLDQGRFQQTDFEIASSLSNMLVAALVRARQQASLQADHQRLMDKNAGFDDLIGDSRPMLDLKSKITRVARASGCVLVRGESGAGKELVARAIHKSSARADRPLLTVNFAAMPRDLMESQLFGHKKGAFTGAESDHVGWFQQADSGTLFLDEVGEMTLEGQAKLLRILEGHPFMPVGGAKQVSVDVRVIAATNRDLSEFVRERRFREDLYYRLSVFELYIPPLRDRSGDIDVLIGFFLQHFKLQHGRPQLELTDAARDKLRQYNWPGNVRQLRNVIDSAVVLAEADRIEAQDLGLRDAGGAQNDLESLRFDFWEKKLIAEALKRTRDNVPEAARLLGIGRATLYRKIDDYQIER